MEVSQISQSSSLEWQEESRAHSNSFCCLFKYAAHTWSPKIIFLPHFSSELFICETHEASYHNCYSCYITDKLNKLRRNCKHALDWLILHWVDCISSTHRAWPILLSWIPSHDIVRIQTHSLPMMGSVLFCYAPQINWHKAQVLLTQAETEMAIKTVFAKCR